MTLEDILTGQSLSGIEPALVVAVIACIPVGANSRQLVYRRPDGTIRERLLSRADEPEIALATTERPWSFEGNSADFQLACEAKRIDLAFLFDPMMAVHTSNVDPLPHQITAVYEAMLPRQPLRFVLADDPGAGKTIMAGLYIRELLLRADARRVLIVAPGSLVDQWQLELHEKFGLTFHIYSTQLDDTSPSGNAFEDHAQLIVRLDQVSRREDLQDKLCAPGWDLVIFDEAHKLAAHYFGSKLEKTSRFRFAEKVGAHTRHLLLMTATPHNGKEEDFQLFLSLLDSDRFYGKFRDGAHKVDASDLMRRMVKEELLKFDGTPLFPERKAYTVNYTLSDLEAELYQAVTTYVQTEMGKADLLQGARKGSVGFALTALQRRLASSPEAIYQSLRRRRVRLDERLREARLMNRGRQLAETVFDAPDDDDELNADEQESLEETLVDQATAAESITDLAAEIHILEDLERRAKAVVVSGQDRKWDELSRILQHDPAMADLNNRRRKLIIFTEHRDTLNYLRIKTAGVLGSEDGIVCIHGGTHRDERRRVQTEFRSNPDIVVLLATDAAGEGVNLQVANLMVNYDLPWNPNRLEQRFGRIHRIGQTEVCHLWNLVAKETREGDVYHRLLQKLDIESDALQGRVFDILGEVFEETRLKDLLIEAIRYGDQPHVRERLNQKIDNALDHSHLKNLLDRNALAQETLSTEQLFRVKEEMDKAEARRLQPYFVRAFFTKAFASLGGTMHARDFSAGTGAGGGRDRFELTFVPPSIRERDRRITGRNRRDQEPVLKKYERICFEKQMVQPANPAGLARALLMHPGHPLMLAMTDMLLEQHANLMRQGAVLVDPADASQASWLLVLLTHEVKSGDGTVISKRIQFVRVDPDGRTTFAGWAPHLDLLPVPSDERPALASAIHAPWLDAATEQRAIALAADTLVPDHFREVADRRIAHCDLTLAAVHERLTKEIAFWTDRWQRLKEDLDAGKGDRLNIQNADRTIRELDARLESRKAELASMRHVVSGTPIVLGAALVLADGLYRALTGHDQPDPPKRTDIPPGDHFPDGDLDHLDSAFGAMTKAVGSDGDSPLKYALQDEAPPPPSEPYEIDPALKAKTERIAMDVVRAAEESRGCKVVDVSKEKCGWDLTSYPPADATSGKQPEPRHIEVKGRRKGQSTIAVTRNEILYAFNQGDKFVMAIVLVDDDDQPEGPHYVRNPFDREPDWGVASVNYQLSALMTRAEAS